MSTTKSLSSSKNFDPSYPQMNLNQISNRSPFFKKNGNISEAYAGIQNKGGPGQPQFIQSNFQHQTNKKDGSILNDVITKKRASQNNGLSKNSAIHEQFSKSHNPSNNRKLNFSQIKDEQSKNGFETI